MMVRYRIYTKETLAIRLSTPIHNAMRNIFSFIASPMRDNTSNRQTKMSQMIFDRRVRPIQETLRIKHKMMMRTMYFDALANEFIVIYMIIPFRLQNIVIKCLKVDQTGIQKIYVYSLIQLQLNNIQLLMNDPWLSFGQRHAMPGFDNWISKLAARFSDKPPAYYLPAQQFDNPTELDNYQGKYSKQEDFMYFKSMMKLQKKGEMKFFK